MAELEKVAQGLLDRYGSVSDPELAVKMARDVEGISFSGDEVAEVEGPEALQDLVEKIRETVGPVALKFIRETLEEQEGTGELEEGLPDEYTR